MFQDKADIAADRANQIEALPMLHRSAKLVSRRHSLDITLN
jgi:hypothetical protein